MTDRRKSIFNWNHISDKLTKDQINELKAYYHTYHRKCWAYKQAVKRYKKWKLLGNSLSIYFCIRRPRFKLSNGRHFFDCYHHSRNFDPGLDEA